MHDFSVNLFYTLSYPLNLCFTWSSIFVDSCIGTLLHQLNITAPLNTHAPQHWRRITGALFGMIGLKAALSLSLLSMVVVVVVYLYCPLKVATHTKL